MTDSADDRPGRVRVAKLQEIDCVAALWALITEHHERLDPLFRMRRGPVAEGELRELLRALHRDPDCAILVFDRGGTPEGLCIVRIDRAPPILEETERAEITDLGVRPELRRQGVGRKLVDEAQEWAREPCCRTGRCRSRHASSVARRSSSRWQHRHQARVRRRA